MQSSPYRALSECRVRTHRRATGVRSRRYERYERAVRRSGHIEDDEDAMAAMVAPAMKAGSLLIFDYRLIHRGLPNLSRERCMAYAVLSTGGAVSAPPHRTVAFSGIPARAPHPPRRMPAQIARRLERRRRMKAWTPGSASRAKGARMQLLSPDEAAAFCTQPAHMRLVPCPCKLKRFNCAYLLSVGRLQLPALLAVERRALVAQRCRRA